MQKLSLSATVLLLATTALITYHATYNAIEKKYSETIYTLAQENSPYSRLNAIDNIARKSYINEIDEEKLEENLIYGYLVGIGDKYASYMNSEEYELYSSQKNGSQVGIGVNVVYKSSVDGLYVTAVTKNSPAMQAGLAEGDIITAVDGRTIAERGYENTITYIASGKEGEPVTLTVKKGPKHTVFVDYEVKRSIIEAHTVTHNLYSDNIGYIKITAFNTTTPTEFKTAMSELQSKGAVRYVFDVRNNPGGSLDSIKEILDYLLPEGPIIKIHTKDGSEQIINSDKNCINAKMAVLVNGDTASAAELFASALRDYDKAKLVGENTYGKGTMQTILPLSPEIGGGAVSISTGMYSPPYSDNYEGKGLVPDVIVSLPKEQAEIFYKLPLSDDAQFQASLKTIAD